MIIYYASTPDCFMLKKEKEALIAECRELHNKIHPDNAITAQDWPGFKAEWNLWPPFVLKGRVELYRQLLKN